MLVLRDRPGDVGLLPYGGDEAVPQTAPTRGAARRAMTVLSDAARNKALRLAG